MQVGTLSINVARYTSQCPCKYLLCFINGKCSMSSFVSALMLSPCNWVRVIVIVFNATFNNISVILLRSDLLVEKTGVPGENHRPAASN